MAEQDIQGLVREVISEFLQAQTQRAEPGYRTELAEEKRRREELEQRVNELVKENQKAKQVADQAEKDAAIKSELTRLGVAKLDLAYRAVKDAVLRGTGGELVARDGASEWGLKEYLERFVAENPELLPARHLGGSGALGGSKTPVAAPVDLGRIGPGMSQEDLARARAEIARMANQALRGL